MPSGNKNAGQEIGHSTRFNGSNAAEMNKRSLAVRRARAPIKKCLRHIATEALYGHPPLSDDQLRPVAKFFHIGVKDVTFAELAIYKQTIEMAKGDQSALNLVAAYAGEKPSEHVEIATVDYSALDAAFDALAGDHDG